MKSDQFLQKDVWPSFCITGHFSLTFWVTFCFTSSPKPKHSILCLHLLWLPKLFVLVIVTLLLNLWTLSHSTPILLGLFNGESLEGLNGLNWYRWVSAATQYHCPIDMLQAAKQNLPSFRSQHTRHFHCTFTTMSPPSLLMVCNNSKSPHFLLSPHFAFVH